MEQNEYKSKIIDVVEIITKGVIGLMMYLLTQINTNMGNLSNQQADTLNRVIELKADYTHNNTKTDQNAADIKELFRIIHDHEKNYH